MLRAGLPIGQGAGPAAHFKGQVFRYSGFVAEIFKQVFQAARGPGKELVSECVLGLVLGIKCYLAFAERNFSFFISILGVRIPNEEDGTIWSLNIYMVDVECQALAFFDAG